MLHGGGNAGPKINDEQWRAAQQWHRPNIQNALYVCPRCIVDTEAVPWLNQDTYALVYQSSCGSSSFTTTSTPTGFT